MDLARWKSEDVSATVDMQQKGVLVLGPLQVLIQAGQGREQKGWARKEQRVQGLVNEREKDDYRKSGLQHWGVGQMDLSRGHN
jgi:hypothetical protein